MTKLINPLRRDDRELTVHIISLGGLEACESASRILVVSRNRRVGAGGGEKEMYHNLFL